MNKERLISLLLLEETEDIGYPFRCMPSINSAFAKIKAERIIAEIEKEVNGKIQILIDGLIRIAKFEGAPDIDAQGEYLTGLYCGVEDKGCTDKYSGAQYGYTVGIERALEWAVNEARHTLEQFHRGKEDLVE